MFYFYFFLIRVKQTLLYVPKSDVNDNAAECYCFRFLDFGCFASQQYLDNILEF